MILLILKRFVAITVVVVVVVVVDVVVVFFVGYVLVGKLQQYCDTLAILLDLGGRNAYLCADGQHCCCRFGCIFNPERDSCSACSGLADCG